MDNQAGNFETFEQRAEVLRQNNKLPGGCTLLTVDWDKERTTERYTPSDDFKACEIFNAHGWFVHGYNQRRARLSQKAGYRTYCASYRNASLPAIGNEGTLSLLQIGARDGTKALRFALGFYRATCENQLIASNNVFCPLRIIHISNIPEQLEEISCRVADAAPILYQRIETMSKVKVTENQALDIACHAAGLRFGPKDKYSVEPRDLLRTNRYSDDGLSLWKVMNRIQENIIKAPSLTMTTKDGKIRKARELRDVDTVFSINQKLWEICEGYIQ